MGGAVKPQSTLTLLIAALATGSLAVGDEPTETRAEANAPPSAKIGNIATAELEPVGNSGVSGTATFVPLADGLRIEVAAMGLTRGQHGVHLHENGDCSAPDASSAGGHFSPNADSHGAPEDPPQEHHAGDLGNLEADATGAARVTREDTELALIGEYGIVGKAVIIHRRADDLVSQPSGDAGDRVACGVITW
jgi:Cu-Zn family superoxide dismutase